MTCRSEENTRLERDSARSDKHLDHMTLTTTLPSIDVSIDFCHTEAHTYLQSNAHTHTQNTFLNRQFLKL